MTERYVNDSLLAVKQRSITRRVIAVTHFWVLISDWNTPPCLPLYRIVPFTIFILRDLNGKQGIRTVDI